MMFFIEIRFSAPILLGSDVVFGFEKLSVTVLVANLKGRLELPHQNLIFLIKANI